MLHFFALDKIDLIFGTSLRWAKDQVAKSANPIPPARATIVIRQAQPLDTNSSDCQV